MIALTAAAFWPVTTRYGVDYHWSARRITLFEKTVHFISRDLQMRRLAAEIVGDRRMDDDGLVYLFEWVRAHVSPTPPGFHVYDDHVWNILIRGYGATDQQAEALAVLASYRGLPATALRLDAPGVHEAQMVTLIRTDDRTIVFDVHNGVVFRRADGRLASVDELARDPVMVARSAAGVTTRSGYPYAKYFEHIDSAAVSFTRMEKQKPWPRLLLELQRVFGR